MNKELSELRLAFAKMGAEIEKLEEQQKGVWEPEQFENFYWIDSLGLVCRNSLHFISRMTHHNAYQTRAQAQKAATLIQQSNRIIQACLNFDPDYVPDWTDDSYKYSVHYAHGAKYWIVCKAVVMGSRPAYVSSKEIAQSICDMFNAEDKHER